MLQLAVRGGRLAQRPVFPERLDEQGPRQGFFEHGEYQAVRRYLPPPYQDILDFAYYSGWRKREILELPWREVDAAGGVIRLAPQRSKTRVGRVLPISAPIAAVLARRRAQRRGQDPLVFRRDTVTVRAWRTAWPEACRLLFTCNGAILYTEGCSDFRAALLRARQTEASLEARGCTEAAARRLRVVRGGGGVRQVRGDCRRGVARSPTESPAV